MVNGRMGEGRRQGHAGRVLGAVLACAFTACPAWGAEIRGVITVKGTGLFAGGRETHAVGGISVSAAPLEGQRVPQTQPRTHTVRIRERKFEPLYLTVPRGDAVLFVNEDGVFHELFSLSRVLPFRSRLARAPVPASRYRQRLDQAGTWHVFCRIHGRMYARIDVVDTPFIRHLTDGGEFRFRGPDPGRWRLRVAALGAEVRELEAAAITAPPPLRIVLSVRGGTPAAPVYQAGAADEIERLFPHEAGPMAEAAAP